MEKQHDIKILNTLIVTTIDSALGFEESAREVQNRRYEAQFMQFARERRKTADDLQAQVRQLGGSPEDDGSVKAAAHRRWVSFKTAITGTSDGAVFSEIKTGETYIREKYETALKDEQLSPETRSVVEKGLGSVRAGQFFASRLDQALNSASTGSSSRGRSGFMLAGAAGLVGAAYAAYRMFGAKQEERHSLPPRIAQEYGGGRDADGRVRVGQDSTDGTSRSLGN